eukprot:2568718-Pyramimonas_sp.AAC.1
MAGVRRSPQLARPCPRCATGLQRHGAFPGGARTQRTSGPWPSSRQLPKEGPRDIQLRPRSPPKEKNARAKDDPSQSHAA